MTEGVQVGCYPRLNGKMVHSGNFVERIVSVVGVFVQDDGEVAVFECSDGGTFSVSHAPDQFVQIGIPFFVEAVGSLAMDETGQPIMNLFVQRDLGADFDLETYNQMIELQQSPKFRHLFSP